MKITRLETIRVRAYPNILFIQLYTDEGIVGLGETYFGAEAVESYLHESAASHLLGANPLAIDRLGQVLVPYVGATGTGVEVRGNSAVDIALWDILGKVTGQPIYQLMGGATRDDIRIYNTCAGHLYMRARPVQATKNWGLPESGDGTRPGPFEDLDAFLYRADELAVDLLESGVTAMKIWPFDRAAERGNGQDIEPHELDEALEPFRKIRAAVGRRMEIMVEMHGLWNLPAAKRIVRALQEFEPAWIEDPLRPPLVTASLGELARTSPSVLTLSETLAGRASFLPLLEQGLIGVVMVDVGWCGGLTEAKKIASLADAYLVPVAPHDCTGPVVLIASTHLAVSISNAYIQETVRAFYHGWYKDLVTHLPALTNGRIRPPAGPGLGAELHPDVVHRADVSIRESKS